MGVEECCESGQAQHHAGHRRIGNRGFQGIGAAKPQVGFPDHIERQVQHPIVVHAVLLEVGWLQTCRKKNVSRPAPCT